MTTRDGNSEIYVMNADGANQQRRTTNPADDVAPNWQRLSSSAIVTQPKSQTIAPGQTATLTVVGTGTAPLTYQWYEGANGDTAHPIATGSSFTSASDEEYAVLGAGIESVRFCDRRFQLRYSPPFGVWTVMASGCDVLLRWVFV